MEEIWRPVKGYEGCYEVSNLGRVRSVEREVVRRNQFGVSSSMKVGGIMKPTKRGDYLKVGLYGPGKSFKTVNVHRLVAEAFLPNPEGLPQVNHKDEDKTNNCVDNLEWCVCKYNINYGTGLTRRGRSQGRKLGKYTIDGVLVATFDTAPEAAAEAGVNRSLIQAVASGKRKTAKGHVYKYIAL